MLLKADAQGSVGGSGRCPSKDFDRCREVENYFIRGGGINETDVLLAAASKAIIIGFHVRPDTNSVNIAEREGVEIRLYRLFIMCLMTFVLRLKDCWLQPLKSGSWVMPKSGKFLPFQKWGRLLGVM